MRILGVDCGRVILGPLAGIVPGSLESLREIAQSGKFEKILIISRAESIGQAYFAARLQLCNFWNYTGIPESNLIFCLYSKQKSVICKKLGITDFIDDNVTTLSHMSTVAHRYAFNPWRKKMHVPRHKNMVLVHSWKELLPQII